MSEMSIDSSYVSWGDPEIVEFLTSDFQSVHECQGVKVEEAGSKDPKGFRVMVMTDDGNDWQELAVANASLPAGELEESTVVGVDLGSRRSLSVAFIGTGSISAGYAQRIIAAYDEAYRDACMALNDEVMHSFMSTSCLDQLISRGPVTADEFNSIRRVPEPAGRAESNRRKAWQTCYGPARKNGRVR